MSATGVSVDVASELRSICGNEYVSERPIGGVYVSPASPEEVAAVLALANERKLSVGPAGGSTERSAAELRVEILMHLNRVNEVEHYDHGDLTVGIGAGTTVAQLRTLVGADKLMFAVDPAQPNRCTIGGLLATAAHGPLRHGYGSVRDFCIGVRFVTGDGRCAKGGGRVVKNVAGYDLMKLLIGSYGTLAVITSASFKLFPAPRQTRTFVAGFSTANEALEFRDRVMKSPLSPMCLELVSPGARALMRPDMTSDAWVMCLRAAGSDTVLARYRKELGSAISRELEGDGESRMWSAIEDFPNSSEGQSEASTRLGPRQRIQITVPPRDVLRVIESINGAASDEAGIAMIGLVGVGHLLLAPSANQPSEALFEALRKSIGESISVKFDGAPNPWPLAPASMESMRAVKRALDPNNVLRGRDIS